MVKFLNGRDWELLQLTSIHGRDWAPMSILKLRYEPEPCGTFRTRLPFEIFSSESFMIAGCVNVIQGAWIKTSPPVLLSRPIQASQDPGLETASYRPVCLGLLVVLALDSLLYPPAQRPSPAQRLEAGGPTWGYLFPSAYNCDEPRLYTIRRIFSFSVATPCGGSIVADYSAAEFIAAAVGLQQLTESMLGVSGVGPSF